MAKRDLTEIIEHKSFNRTAPFPNQGVNFNWCRKNWGYSHDHDYYEFVVITDGKVTHKLNNRTTLATKGMLFLIKPNDFHQFIPYHNSNIKYINFWVSVSALQELSNAIWREDLSKTINEFEFSRDLFLPQKDFESILNLINRLSQFPLQSQNRYALIKSIVIELLLFLLQEFNMQKLLTETQSYPVWLNAFLSNLHDPKVFTLKLQDIYPLAPYSRPMLNIYFKKYMGTTLIAYITQLKINHACTLLQFSDFTPLEISNQLCYDSLSHFNRIFKKFTGLSPIAYRKKVLNQNQT